MAFTILSGDRIEGLAEALKKRLLARRKSADPFAFEKVVVPNGNVAKWLQIRKFAGEPSLCAGIEFPFMEQRLTELLRRNLSPADQAWFELLPDHAYARAIASILLEGPDRQPEHTALAPFRKYFDADSGTPSVDGQKQARMAWQLADKLADLMDSYEVHRPEVVDTWLGRALDPRNRAYVVGTGEAEQAEAALARALWGEGGRFPAGGNRLSLRQLFDKVCAEAPRGPAQTIYIFGHSTLSLLQVRILAWLARTHEVVFFHNNPCREYWGDITTAREDRKARYGLGADGVNGADPEEGFACENVLLKDLGVAGRETLRLLVDLEEENGNEGDPAKRIDFNWEFLEDAGEPPDTVLGRLQKSIRDRTSEVGRRPQDASVQIIGAPGLRREVEMVYNSILGSVCRPEGVTGTRPWPDCSFSDIAVLVPDMKTYRPVIEAVFKARGEVPYGLVDTTASEESQLLRGFLALIELGRKGLGRARLFDVLENPCVQLALGFSREDVVEWRTLAEKIGAFDNWEHEEAKGWFDWSSALRRLRLARVADEVETPDGDSLPLVKEGGDVALKFSEVVELLHRDLRETLFDAEGKPRRLPCMAQVAEDGQRGDCWAERLGRIVKEYLAAEKDDALESRIRQAVLGALYSLGDVPGRQSFEFAVAAVEEFVGTVPCRKGGYLTSGVTIAGLAPMRPVPFKQVYMLGMGAGGFPGRTRSSTLDIRGTGWRLGDVSMPNMNRYLFLETLMAVRDRFVLSYPNLDIEKDAELFPSGLVRLVETFIGDHVLEKPFKEFENYPLLERGELELPGPYPTDPVVWKADDAQAGLLPTYSQAARKLARARIAAATRKAEADPSAPTPAASTPPAGRIELSAKVLAEFIKSPVRAVMRYRFGIAVAGYLDTDLEPDAPLGRLDGPDKWNLQALWMVPDAKAAVEAEFRRLQLSGRVPAGKLGELAKDGVMKDADRRIAAVKSFVSGFALANGTDNTLHLCHATEFGTGDDALKVRFVAEIPNWKEAEPGEVSVVTTGSLEDKPATTKSPAKLQSLVGDRCLEPFLAFLMYAVAREEAVESTLRLGVVDLDKGMGGTWRWTVDAKTARSYLERLVRDFLSCEKGAEKGCMVDFTFKKLRGALPDSFVDKRDGKALDWTAVLATLEKPDPNWPKRTFNNDLVVEQNLEPFRRSPTAEELKEIFERRHRFPLTGIRVEQA